jgi:hypothetical protein
MYTIVLNVFLEDIMLKNDILNKFGKDFIKGIVDLTVEHMEMIISGKMKNQEAQILYKRIEKTDIESMNILNEIIMETIKQMTFNVLNFFEEERGKYLLEYNNGKEKININEISDGLAGELYSEDGWIKKYSKKLNV